MREGRGGRLYFPKMAQWHLPAPVLSCNVTSLKRRRLFLHPLESTWALWLLWPVEFSRQDTMTVPPAAFSLPGSFCFLPLGMFTMGKTRGHTRSPVPLGLPFCEEAQFSHVKRLCGEIVPAIPEMGVKIPSYTHSSVEPSDDPRLSSC